MGWYLTTLDTLFWLLQNSYGIPIIGLLYAPPLHLHADLLRVNHVPFTSHKADLLGDSMTLRATLGRRSRWKGNATRTDNSGGKRAFFGNPGKTRRVWDGSLTAHTLDTLIP